MNIDTPMLLGLISLTITGAGVVFTYRASKNATKVEETKVDLSAYNQANTFYKDQLAAANTQIDRAMRQVDNLTGQIERLTARLAAEQDISNTLRNQVKSLQGQVDLLSRTISALKSGLNGEETR